jgi:hypothetical protein
MPAPVTIRYIERTCLEEEALKKVVERYTKTDKEVLVIFDMRIKDYGDYVYDEKKRRHVIRISPAMHLYESFEPKSRMLTKEGQKVRLLATLLHECRHIQQKEELGRTFYTIAYCRNTAIHDTRVSEDYSECEIDARVYENKNVLAAVEYYDSLVE